MWNTNFGHIRGHVVLMSRTSNPKVEDVDIETSIAIHQQLKPRHVYEARRQQALFKHIDRGNKRAVEACWAWYDDI